MPTHADEMLDALEFRYGNCPPEAVIAISTALPDDTQFLTATYKNTPANWKQITGAYAGRQDIQVWSRMSVLPGNWNLDYRGSTANRGKESDTWGTAVIHVDIDPEDDSPGVWEDWREYKLAQVRQHTPVPSRIEFSGRGFYALWRLKEFEQDWEAVKRANKAVCRVLGGDHCFDTSRILRLPGSFNAKPNVQRWARRVA
jgi:hypothetical protein